MPPPMFPFPFLFLYIIGSAWDVCAVCHMCAESQCPSLLYIERLIERLVEWVEEGSGENGVVDNL